MSQQVRAVRLSSFGNVSLGCFSAAADGCKWATTLWTLNAPLFSVFAHINQAQLFSVKHKDRRRDDDKAGLVSGGDIIMRYLSIPA